MQVGSVWIGQQTQKNVWLDAVSSENFDLLIVDHYALDFRWDLYFDQKFRKIMVIDDLADREA